MKTKNENYKKAQEQVDALKGFYGHLFAYVLVMLFLLFINLYTSPGYLWVVWPALGWGIGLVSHAIGVFQWVPFLGKDWEEKKIKQILDKENKNQWK